MISAFRDELEQKNKENDPHLGSSLEEGIENQRSSRS